jgi:hypothetical protein
MEKKIKKLRRDTARAATEGVLDIIGSWLKPEEVPILRAELVVYLKATLGAYDELRAATVKIEPSVN